VLRQPLLETYGLDESQVMVCLSHSHATPSMAAADVSRPGGELIPAYAAHVVQQLQDAADQAVKSQIPATMTWRYGKCDLATNRDFPDPQGGRTLTGWNPKLPADDTLLVGRVTRDEDDKVLATVVNYACHPTTLAWENRLVSPDYVGAMREVVEGQTAGSPCLFLQGASGDLAPAYQYTGDVSVADQHGRRLGHAVISTLLGMTPPNTTLAYQGAVESGAVLAVWKPKPIEADRTLASIRLEMSLPLKARPTLEEQDEQIRQCQDRALTERLVRSRRRLEFFKDMDRCPVSLYAWRIGSALLLSHPLEAYSAWQVRLRQQQPGRAIAAINLANGALGYVVPEAQCDPGLYAWWQTLFGKESFDLLTQASQAAMNQLLDSGKDHL
jgi:hypothetical protein